MTYLTLLDYQDFLSGLLSYGLQIGLVVAVALVIARSVIVRKF